jgi:hypothetical protein
MRGAPTETVLKLWGVVAAGRQAMDVCPLFSLERTAVSAGAFVGGLLSEELDKTGWMRAQTERKQRAAEELNERPASPESRAGARRCRLSTKPQLAAR